MINSGYSIVITDDEPIAREILAGYIARMPELTLVASCANALEAMTVISSKPVSILLMDINMPEISGMQLVRSLKDAPLVIFTTAYSEYAVESYDLNAVDYLLKPISFHRFSTAIQKACNILASRQSPAAQQEHIFFKSDGKWVKMALQDILFVEGLKDYVRIHTNAKKLVVHSTMRNMETQLVSGSGPFLRVHKSFIINTAAISEIQPQFLKLGDHLIPIGSTYRRDVTALLDRLK